MLRRVLVANRGEIACRIFRTCRRLGIGTVAVFSEADAGALHVAMADAALPVGPAPARDSYLDGARIIAAARQAGADAVHPGYGFLAERADFAEACEAAGLVFVGPPPAAMRALGMKDAARTLAARLGVPVLPGYAGPDQSAARLLAEAEAIGFPVLIKAVAGGGGRGMRRVDAASGFPRALAAAQREAGAGFGHDGVLVERCLLRPRHIEVQVFADTRGHAVQLFERDCSVQRRHQKIIEESPAPGISGAMRAAMGEAALRLVRAVDYAGAGTVEFIVDAERFHFLEMNTRLQVEHPATEMVTGLDLVEWQLRVAAGEALPPAPSRPAGHAIEVRICAEDPKRNFLPSPGTLTRFDMPAESESVRVDTGFRAGDAVTPFYDSLLAKLIVRGGTRAEALAWMAAALLQCRVEGIASNVALLHAVVTDGPFMGGEVDTGYLERRRAEVVR